ncbi:MAG: hypothetical protein HYX48_03510 [Chlamydiales bacterium]|nr:hypothetical protein [Chlamydiales bacterium]
MAAKGPLDEVPGKQRIDATAPIGEEQKLSTTGQPFSSYMEEAKSSTLGGTTQTPLASPFDIAAGQTKLPATPTLATITNQVSNAQSTLGDVNSYLSNSNLRLKQSSKYLLKNKLQDANTHIRTASTRLGAEPKEEEEMSAGTGPMSRFIGYVTNGQSLLNGAKQRLAQMQEKGDNMKPADFLLIQVQLNLAQQSLEYSSVVLSKAMDDVKMLLNVQL